MEKRSFKGMRGFWTKYGGAKKAPLQEALEALSTWYCQSCGQPQPAELSPFVKEFPVGEYIRVCALCMNDKSVVLEVRIKKILILEK